ncbi:MAG: hypothetical protein NTZ87_02310 [Candidatus Nomurabacteria bacterium]|nr:hypothetical protein [Candidatus Nomurabacteria bacterium]
MWDFIFKAGAIAGIVGLIPSIAAFFQAKGAKEAAQMAGGVVTLQKINYDILEIMHTCGLEYEIKMPEVNNKYGDINSRVMIIVETLDNPIYKEIFDNIKNDLQATYNEIQSSVDPEELKIPGFQYNRFISLFNQLKGALGRLKGKIDKELLKNNK